MKFTNNSSVQALAVHGVLRDKDRLLMLEPSESVSIPKNRVRSNYKTLLSSSLSNLTVNPDEDNDSIDDSTFIERTESVKISITEPGTVFLTVPWQRDPTPEECKILEFLYPKGCSVYEAKTQDPDEDEDDDEEDLYLTTDLKSSYEVTLGSPIELTVVTNIAAENFELIKNSSSEESNSTGTFSQTLSFTDSGTKFKIRATKGSKSVESTEATVVVKSSTGIEGTSDISVSASVYDEEEGLFNLSFTSNLTQDSSIKYKLVKQDGSEEGFTETTTHAFYKEAISEDESGLYEIKVFVDDQQVYISEPIQVTVRKKN